MFGIEANLHSVSLCLTIDPLNFILIRNITKQRNRCLFWIKIAIEIVHTKEII